MKKMAVVALVVMVNVVLAASSLAESATKEECIAKCREAARLIIEKGPEAAIPELNKKDGKFVWKDTYVFVLDFRGTHLTHPLRPEVVGKNVLEWKVDGKFVVKEFIEIAKAKGEGWVEYMYPKPAELKKPEKERILSKKATYVYRVPGKDMFVAAGVWEGEGSVREECVALCKAAAKFIDEKGVEAAITEIGKREGKFVSKNTYVFLMDLDGNRLAHPYKAPNDPKIMKLFEMKDTNGKSFVQEYIELAKTKGEGWTEYMYPKPEELKKPTPFKDKVSSKKISFVYRVPGKDLMVIAGFFE